MSFPPASPIGANNFGWACFCCFFCWKCYGFCSDGIVEGMGLFNPRRNMITEFQVSRHTLPRCLWLAYPRPPFFSPSSPESKASLCLFAPAQCFLHLTFTTIVRFQKNTAFHLHVLVRTSGWTKFIDLKLAREYSQSVFFMILLCFVKLSYQGQMFYSNHLHDYPYYDFELSQFVFIKSDSRLLPLSPRLF